MRAPLLSAAALALLTPRLAGAVSCEPPSVDWSQFPSGYQCIVGVQQFVHNRWGLTFPATGLGKPGAGCAAEGACLEWVDNLPNPAVWNRHPWGSATPQAYDILIFPPVSGDPYGHAAMVDHVDGAGTPWVMDDNWTGNETRSCTWAGHSGWVHNGTWTPYGFYRLKSLEPTCTPACNGNSLVAVDCSQTDCAASGAVCVSDGVPAPVCQVQPKGSLDATGCDAIAGWAQDPSDPSAELTLHATFDGPMGAAGVVDLTLTASDDRPDLCAALGSCDHGFSLPTPRSLLDGGAHQVHVYAVNVAGGAVVELPQSPGALLCSPPALPDPVMLRRVQNASSFADWGFSAFTDVAPLAGDAGHAPPSLDALEGPSLPGEPAVVQADDGTSDLWLLDTGTRRQISGPAAAAAWRLGAATKMPRTQLSAIPLGAALPDRPLLVQTEGPTDFVLDLPFLPAPAASATSAPAASATSAPAASASLPSSAVVAAPSDAKDSSSCALSSGGAAAPSPLPWLAALGLLGERLRRRSRIPARRPDTRRG